MTKAIISGVATVGMGALSYAFATQVYHNAAMGGWFAFASFSCGLAAVILFVATCICVTDA